MSDDIQRIKDALSLVDVVRRDATDTREYNGKIRGDFPGHSSPSTTGENFVADADGWFCFRHDVGGGLLEWIAVVGGHCSCSELGAGTGQPIPDAVFQDVLKDGAARAGIELTGGRQQSDRPDDYAERRHALDDTMGMAAEHYHGLLDDHDMRAPLQEKYGLSDELIDEYQIGYVPPGGAVHGCGADEHALYEAGLLDSDGQDYLDRWADNGRWVFPYWARDGSDRVVRYFIARAVDHDGHGPKYVKLKTDLDAVDDLVQEPPFGVDSLRGEREVVLTEGVTDALALIDAGFAAVAPVTTNIADDQLEEFARVLRGKKVVAVFDEDAESQAGLKGASRCTNHLAQAGVDAEVARLPSRGRDMDCNDYLQEHTADEFRAEVLDGVTLPGRAAAWGYANGPAAGLFHAGIEAIGRDPEQYYEQKVEPEGQDAEAYYVWQSVTDVIGENVRDVPLARRKFYAEGRAELEPDEQNEVYGHVAWWFFNMKGSFFNAGDGATYYFFDPEATVYNVSEGGRLTEEFHGLVEAELGVTSYQWGQSMFNGLARRAAREAPERDAHRLAHYDDERGELYVADFGGGYYALTGDSIEWRQNGTDVFFRPNDRAQPYTYIPDAERSRPDGGVPGEVHPFVGRGDLVNRFLTNRVNYDENSNLGPMDQRHQLYLHLHSIPFANAFSSRPIMAFVGDKGSGKTMTVRGIGRFFFGDDWEETTMPDDKEDFAAIVGNSTLAFIDNYDDGVSWANDALASVATGASIQVRELYTTNDMRNVQPKCFLALTSRDPPFRRDDVAERCLVFRVQRFDEFVGDDTFLGQIALYRDDIWSDYLDNLNQIVTARQETDTTTMTSSHRMASWAVHAQVTADALDIPDVERMLESQQTERAFFTLEDDPLRLALEEWIRQDGGGGSYSAKELREQLATIAEQENISWKYTDSRGLSSRLRSVGGELNELFGMTIDDGGRTNEYVFPGGERTQYMLDRFGSGDRDETPHGPKYDDE